MLEMRIAQQYQTTFPENVAGHFAVKVSSRILFLKKTFHDLHLNLSKHYITTNKMKLLSAYSIYLKTFQRNVAV